MTSDYGCNHDIDPTAHTKFFFQLKLALLPFSISVPLKSFKLKSFEISQDCQKL